jgi:flagellar basal-body rod modification protein FlgD
MSSIDTSGSAATAALAAANLRSGALMRDTQDRFLALLVTQLKNQDPLNPMDNAQVTSQIAQLSTVNGINQLNNTLLALSGQMDISQSLQAASLIGKGVLVPGARVLLGGEGDARQSTPFGMDIPAPVARAAFLLQDAGGQAVRRIELGPQPAGVLSVRWDGLGDSGLALPDGAYMARVEAFSEEGKAVPAEALTYGEVSSVMHAPAGPQLDMGLAGRHALGSVRKIM